MKLGVPFLQFPLLFDADALAAEVQAIDESAWRPHPAGYAGNDALLLVTVGGDPTSDATAGPMSATEHLRRCPYLMQVLEQIGGTWGRSRLMRLSGRAEVTSHVDINYYWRERARVHVPIVTQPTVRFVCGEAEVNMRAGECWIFDTWAEHNVINDHYLSRIHLVADTVGGAGFWEHVSNARPHQAEIPGWQPRACPPVAGYVPDLDYEAENFPTVMTPWEIRTHYAFLMGEASAHTALPLIHGALLQFSRRWQALWARYGERPEGWTRYRDAIETVKLDLVACGAESVDLRNGVRLMEALQAWIFEPALAAHRRTADAEIRQRAGQATAVMPDATSTRPRSAATREARDSVFDRPVFIVCPPRSGSTLLFETMAQAPDVFTIGDESHQLIEGVATLAPAARGFESNRLVAADATPEVAAGLRSSFFAALRDRAQRRPVADSRVRMLEKTPKNALRVQFLARVFPEARFIYLHRDPRPVLASMMEAWTSGRFRTYPNLPGWTGLPWSLLLVPGWRDLLGQPLHQVVAAQWNTTTGLLLDDLEQLPPGCWTAANYEALVANPAAEIRRLCAANDLAWDTTLPQALPLSSYTVSTPDPAKWQRYAAEIDAVLPMIDAQARRAERLALRTLQT
jgi:Sulfotransferase family/Aspartyl/Asparaginyl beta-hydroxylase